jgi:hypothetical protein
MRDAGHVKNRAVYVAIGVNLEGSKDVLGLWSSDHEGAKLWLQVVTELRNRGVEDIFIACVDGLKGFPEAIELVYPKTQVQLCIVHMVRHSLNYVSWKQRRAVAADLRNIYTAVTTEAAEVALEAFAEKWDKSHPTISQVWRRNWERITPFFAYPAEIRKVIYTTNAIESLNMSLRKIIKTRGSFLNEEAAMRCSGWPCGTIRRSGALCRTGVKRSTASRYYGPSGCRHWKGVEPEKELKNKTRSKLTSGNEDRTEALENTVYTKHLTPPNRGFDETRSYIDEFVRAFRSDLLRMETRIDARLTRLEERPRH